MGYKDGMNLYQAVRSAPIHRVDPTGLDALGDAGTRWWEQPPGSTVDCRNPEPSAKKFCDMACGPYLGIFPDLDHPSPTIFLVKCPKIKHEAPKPEPKPEPISSPDRGPGPEPCPQDPNVPPGGLRTGDPVRCQKYCDFFLSGNKGALECCLEKCIDWPHLPHPSCFFTANIPLPIALRRIWKNINPLFLLPKVPDWVKRGEPIDEECCNNVQELLY